MNYHLQETKRWEWIIFYKGRDENESFFRKEGLGITLWQQIDEKESLCCKKVQCKIPFAAKKGWKGFLLCQGGMGRIPLVKTMVESIPPYHAWKGWEGFSLWQWMDKEDSPFYQNEGMIGIGKIPLLLNRTGIIVNHLEAKKEWRSKEGSPCVKEGLRRNHHKERKGRRIPHWQGKDTKDSPCDKL